MIKPTILFVTLFFLKTTLFNIVVNPTLGVCIPFIIIFTLTGDLDNKAPLLLMLFFSLTFQFIRPIYASSLGKPGNKININVFNALLPVKTGLLSQALILTILITPWSYIACWL